MPPAPGLAHFSSPYYQDHNRARLAHLASLGLLLANRRVLEPGSGPGDHTQFYVERECTVVSVDSCQECLEVLARHFPGVQTVQCDLNAPAPPRDLGAFDVVHCYGILYLSKILLTSFDLSVRSVAPPLIRSGFVASQKAQDLPSLSPVLLDLQERLA
jgi:hypothetical protein